MEKPVALECPAIDDRFKNFPQPVDVGTIDTPLKDIEQGRNYGVAYKQGRDRFNQLVGAVETREKICNELGVSLNEASGQIDEVINQIKEEAEKEDKKFLGLF